MVTAAGWKNKAVDWRKLSQNRFSTSRVELGSVEFSLQRPSPLWESDARRLALKYTLDLFDTFHKALALIAVV